MKIAVLSDTHIPVRLQSLPGLVYEVCADADLIIHAGDVEQPDVIEDLARFAPVKVVRGNMDLPLFPDHLLLELEGFRVFVAHGSGAYGDVRGRLRKMVQEASPHIVVHGHTHVFHWQSEHGMWFLCPGAVANPPGSRSVAVLILEKGKAPEVRKVAF